jgi:hypothetical protein
VAALPAAAEGVSYGVAACSRGRFEVSETAGDYQGRRTTLADDVAVRRATTRDLGVRLLAVTSRTSAPSARASAETVPTVGFACVSAARTTAGRVEDGSARCRA